MGALFAGELASPEDARRAYDLAGSAVLRRMADLERCEADLAGVVGAAPADLGRDDHRLLARVTDLLSGAHDALATRFRDDAGLIAVCAWCKRLRAPGGAYALAFGAADETRSQSSGSIA